MVVSCQLGQVGWRSTLGTSTFGLLCLFNGHKLPENAIKRPFMAISGSGGSKWLDLSGYWLDLGGIHPGWSVGAIWTHQNCPRGPPRALEMAQKCHKTPIYGHKRLRWLQMAGYQWILVGSGWDGLLVPFGPTKNAPEASGGVRISDSEMVRKCHKTGKCVLIPSIT